MKLGIMQPYFFPYIGYWQLINAVDKYVIYDDVNYIKGGWINRNRILMNGNIQFFNIKIKGASSNKLINEIEIEIDKIYNLKLIRTLEYCYKKAPFFNQCLPLIERILNYEEINLAKFLEFSIKEICNYLDIHTEIFISSEIHKSNKLKGEDKVLEICKILNASEYFNAIGGKELYSYEKFEVNNVELKFLQPKEIFYKQFSNDFVKNLSLIDVLMFNSIESIKMMFEKYTLIENKEI